MVTISIGSGSAPTKRTTACSDVSGKHSTATPVRRTSLPDRTISVHEVRRVALRGGIIEDDAEDERGRRAAPDGGHGGDGESAVLAKDVRVGVDSIKVGTVRAGWFARTDRETRPERAVSREETSTSGGSIYTVCYGPEWNFPTIPTKEKPANGDVLTPVQQGSLTSWDRRRPGGAQCGSDFYRACNRSDHRPSCLD